MYLQQQQRQRTSDDDCDGALSVPLTEHHAPCPALQQLRRYPAGLTLRIDSPRKSLLVHHAARDGHDSQVSNSLAYLPPPPPLPTPSCSNTPIITSPRQGSCPGNCPKKTRRISKLKHLTHTKYRCSGGDTQSQKKGPGCQEPRVQCQGSTSHSYKQNKGNI